MIISDLSESLGRIFAAIAYVEAQFHVISIFCLLRLHRALYKIHMWKLFDYGKIKNWKKVLGKERKKKKTGPKKKERVPFCQEKKKIPLWKRLVLAELHAGVQTSNKEVFVKPKWVIHIHSSFSGFSIFAVGFAFACGNFAHYCVVLLNAPPSDRKRKRGVWNQEPITYVLVMVPAAMGYFFREILIHHLWRQEVPLSRWLGAK